MRVRNYRNKAGYHILLYTEYDVSAVILGKDGDYYVACKYVDILIDEYETRNVVDAIRFARSYMTEI